MSTNERWARERAVRETVADLLERARELVAEAATAAFELPQIGWECKVCHLPVLQDEPPDQPCAGCGNPPGDTWRRYGSGWAAIRSQLEHEVRVLDRDIELVAVRRDRVKHSA